MNTPTILVTGAPGAGALTRYPVGAAFPPGVAVSSQLHQPSLKNS